MAFVSFMTFTLVQTVAAVIAGSEAMMGDSAAMFVDALTYLFNLVAERKKNDFDETASWPTTEKDPIRAQRIRQRAKRKMVLTMELLPPLISVTTLITVTIFVSRKAIHVLRLDAHRDVSLQGDPNLQLMLLFSTLNLALDFLNVFCFAKAKHLMGFDTVEGHPTSPTTVGEPYESVDGTDFQMEKEERTTIRTNGNSARLEGTNENGHCSSPDPPGRKGPPPPVTRLESFASSDEDEKSEANLNMCSAYTVSIFWCFHKSIGPHVCILLTRLYISSTTARLCGHITKYRRNYRISNCRACRWSYARRSGCNCCACGIGAYST